MDANSEMRRIRNILLKVSDWTQLADSPLTDSKKKLWASYRQALRDLPSVSSPSLDDNGNLQNLTWPDTPT